MLHHKPTRPKHYGCISNKTDMVDSHASLTFVQAFEDTENELKNNLPPWEKATLSEKLYTFAIKTIILLPVIVVLFIISSTYTIYLAFYIIPILIDNNNRPELYFWHTDSEKTSATIRAIIFIIFLTWNVFWLLFSLYRASHTDPGNIPRTPDWEILLEDSSESSTEKVTMEKRKDGSQRTCNHCQLRKPDRCHHCKQCDRCILKMDHHCNWIANCVGNNNYKYFFLVVFYGAISLILFVSTFWESVVVCLCDDSNSEAFMLFIVTVYALVLLLCITVVAFMFFHVWLMWNNFSTIEFCEKKRAKSSNFDKSPYSQGAYNNFKENLGSNPLMWFLPFGYEKSKDSGIFFNTKKY